MTETIIEFGKWIVCPICGLGAFVAYLVYLYKITE